METIPCIANKCLKYPACKSKRSIECEELYIYRRKLYTHYKKASNQDDIFNDIYSKAAKHLRITFPNLKVITGI